MDIRKHLKAAGVVNTVLIADVFACQIVRLCIPGTVLEKIKTICVMVTLLFGFFYAFFGYKKNAAVYYKTFFIMYAVSILLSAISNITQGSGHVIGMCISLITLCAVVVLAFAKDFGRERTKFTGYFILALALINIVITAINIGGFPVVIGAVEEAALAAVACVFIGAKYADKNRRGRQ